MFGNTLKYYAFKLVKPLLITLPLNLLAGLLYCFLANKMSIISYSNVLTMIGGAYLAIGGMGFMGGMTSETDYTQNFSRDINLRKADNASRGSFGITVLSIGIITMLVSFAILAFR